MFKSLEHFISAINETVYQNPRTHNAAANWHQKFVNAYEQHYGVKLKIPHWSDIEAEYAIQATKEADRGAGRKATRIAHGQSSIFH